MPADLGCDGRVRSNWRSIILFNIEPDEAADEPYDVSVDNSRTSSIPDDDDSIRSVTLIDTNDYHNVVSKENITAE